MEFGIFVEWAFYAVVSGGVVYSSKNLKSMNDSISELNLKVALVIQTTVYHEGQIQEQKKDQRQSKKELEDLKTRLIALEMVKSN